jgi:hypothetical protein
MGNGMWLPATDAEPAVGVVETWVDLSEVHLPFVSFRHTFAFDDHAAAMASPFRARLRPVKLTGQHVALPALPAEKRNSDTEALRVSISRRQCRRRRATQPG